jgi:hypothetical protein
LELFERALRNSGRQDARQIRFEKDHPMNPMKSLLAMLAVLFAGTAAMAASPLVSTAGERYLHVRVKSTNTHELVRVNIPLSLAEKVIPAINHGELQNGKVHIGQLAANEVNLKVILEALKSAPEGEFVTVQEDDSDVHVAKERGDMVVHVSDEKGKTKVNFSIPWDVAQALASDTNDGQLNIEAAIKALENSGDVTLVSVTDHDQTVRVWIDSQIAGE